MRHHNECYQSLLLNRCYFRIFRNKLGLLEKEKDSDELLIKDLLELMHSSGADFTITFRSLSAVPLTVDASASTDDGLDTETAAVLQRIVGALATPEELAADVGPSIAPAQLHMLSMVGARDPTLLQALGITPTVRLTLFFIWRCFDLFYADVGHGSHDAADSHAVLPVCMCYECIKDVLKMYDIRCVLPRVPTVHAHHSKSPTR